MKFNKEKFLQHADKTTKSRLKDHLDRLDGREVEHDSMIRYTVDKEAWVLYPVMEEWCDK